MCLLFNLFHFHAVFVSSSFVSTHLAIM